MRRNIYNNGRFAAEAFDFNNMPRSDQQNTTTEEKICFTFWHWLINTIFVCRLDSSVLKMHNARDKQSPMVSNVFNLIIWNSWLDPLSSSECVNYLRCTIVDPLQQRIKLNNNVTEWEGFVCALKAEVKSCDYSATEVKVVDISNASSCIANWTTWIFMKFISETPNRCGLHLATFTISARFPNTLNQKCIRM